MSKPARGTGYAGELGRKLQRLLGFDGEPNATFTTEMIPVALMMDATQPGYGEQSGRRFGLSFDLAIAGGLWLRPSQDIIIDRIALCNRLIPLGADASYAIYIGPQTVATPALTSTAFFLDRNSGVEVAPIQAGDIGGGSAPLNLVGRGVALMTGEGNVVAPIVPFCLQAGAVLQVLTNTSEPWTVMVYGRQF